MAHSRASSVLKSLTRLSSPILSFSLAQTSQSDSSSRSRRESRSSGRSEISFHLWLIESLADGESDIPISIGGLTDPSTAGFASAPYETCAPRVPTNTEYRDWLAAMYSRFRLGPPKQRLAQISGSRIMPIQIGRASCR